MPYKYEHIFLCYTRRFYIFFSIPSIYCLMVSHNPHPVKKKKCSSSILQFFSFCNFKFREVYLAVEWRVSLVFVTLFFDALRLLCSLLETLPYFFCSGGVQLNMPVSSLGLLLRLLWVPVHCCGFFCCACFYVDTGNTEAMLDAYTV